MDSEQRSTASVQAALMFLITNVAVLTINLYFLQAMQRTACVFPLCSGAALPEWCRGGEWV